MGYEKSLKENYLKVYGDVVTELAVEDLSLDFQMEVKNDLLDLFLSAQEDGVEPKELVGDDAGKFAKNIVDDFNKRNSLFFRVFQFLAQLSFGTAIVSLMNIDIRTFKVEFTVDMLLFVFAFSIAGIIGRLLSKKYKIIKSRKATKFIFEFGTFLIMYGIATIITSNYYIEPFFNINLLGIFIPAIWIWGIFFCIAENRYK